MTRRSTGFGFITPLLVLMLVAFDAPIVSMLGLGFWDKPAAACLSSRIPYGTSVTPERLQQIEVLEDALHALGLRQVRVRYHDALARIEVAKDELEAAFAQRDDSATRSALDEYLAMLRKGMERNYDRLDRILEQQRKGKRS